MERSILYVSRLSLSVVEPDQAIDEIVDGARKHNAALRITGALARTDDHFAQLLEGPGPALDELMQRIEIDPRHTNVTILRIETISNRRLPEWSMAYSGRSSYVARQIVPLMGEPLGQKPLRIERLTSLLVGLAHPVHR